MSETFITRILRHKPRQLFYHFGVRIAVPFSVLKAIVNLMDIGRSPKDYFKRRRAARVALVGSKWRGRMSQNSGFTTFNEQELPGTNEVMEICREILKKREGQLSALNPKVTFHKLLTEDDIRTHPSLINFATSPPLIHTIADYLGTLPRLHDINLLLSPVVDQLRSSHHFHLDKPEVSYIGAFLNIFDVSPQGGPLTILPADSSKRVERRTNYIRRYVLGTDVRIKDHEMEAHIQKDEKVVLTGKAGDVQVLDTSRCFHYGSRCRNEARVVLQIRYAPAHKIPGRRNSVHSGSQYNENALRRLLLAGYSAG